MSKADMAAIAATVGSIYEAAFDDTRWTATLRHLGLLFDASRVCVFHAEGNVVLTASASVDDPQIAAPGALESVLRNPLGAAMLAIPAGTVSHPLGAIDRQRFYRSEVWQDWYRPRDMYDGLTGRLTETGTASWFLDVQCGGGQERFGRREADLLRLIVPHMRRAGEISRSLALHASGIAFDGPSPVFVTAGDGRIVAANPAAHALLDMPDGAITQRAGHLVAASEAGTRRLLARIAACCPEAPDALPDIAGPLVLPPARATAYGRAALLSILPLTGEAYGIAAGRHAAVILHDSVAGMEDARFEDRLRAALDLTRAEARLCALLCQGLSLRQAAAGLNIAFATARSYLIRIYRKSGTASQGQLVSLLKDIQSLPHT